MQINNIEKYYYDGFCYIYRAHIVFFVEKNIINFKFAYGKYKYKYWGTGDKQGVGTFYFICG